MKTSRKETIVSVAIVAAIVVAGFWIAFVAPIDLGTPIGTSVSTSVGSNGVTTTTTTVTYANTCVSQPFGC